MKKTKLLVIGLVVVLIAVFTVGTASATWMSNATVNNVSTTPTGNYTFKATAGTWIKFFTIISSNANANSLLAVVLTAVSGGNTVTIDFTGATINSITINE